MEYAFCTLFSFFLLLTLLVSTTYGAQTEEPAWQKYVTTFAPHRAAIQEWVVSATTDGTPIRATYPRHDIVTCDVCLGAYPIIAEHLSNGSSIQDVLDGITNLCFTMGFYSELTCSRLVGAYAPPIIQTIIHKPWMRKEDVCGIINPGCTVVNSTLVDWQIQIKGQKPPVSSPPLLPEDIEVRRILQFTDLHIDLNYTAGSSAVCNEGLCCRSGLPGSDDEMAKPYGDHRCSLAPLAFDSMIQHAKTKHDDVSYIFMTGDMMHNGLWSYSIEENTRVIKYVTQSLATTFPNIPVYPLTGNHDPQVINSYPSFDRWEEYDLSWMYNLVAEPFNNTLGAEQLATFKIGGYYSATPQPGLRLVVINTNLCYLNNFWLPYYPIDPAGQLQWLADTLYQAEMDKINVFIMGHISPGSVDCWSVWSTQFNRIVNRFEHLIRGQFYGHEHPEYFKLAFELDTERVTSVAYVVPSSLSDVGRSSAYKVYQVDGARGAESTWEIVNHEAWILNTTLSNIVGAGMFQKLYNAKEDYNLESVRGSELYQFVLRMLKDNDLFVKFQKNVNKGLTNGESYGPACDPRDVNFDECRLQVLCYCVTSNPGNNFNCEKLQQIQLKQKSNDFLIT